MRVFHVDSLGFRFEAFKNSKSVTADVGELVQEAEADRRRALGAYGEKWKLETQLVALGQRCADDGWDGGDEMAVPPQALAIAHEFLEDLPAYLPLPDVWPDADGEITFEWRSDAATVINVSVYSDGRLGFSGLREGKPFHGYDRFDHRIPAALLARIEGNLK